MAKPLSMTPAAIVAREWRAAHPGYNAKACAKWQRSNPRKCVARVRRWQKANPKRYKEQQKAYRTRQAAGGQMSLAGLFGRAGGQTARGAGAKK